MRVPAGELSTAGLLRHWAATTPGSTALVWEGGRSSFAELDAAASRVAQGLLSAGVGPGDHVTYLDKNSPEQVELLAGVAKVGAIPTPVNFRLAPPEVAYVVADADTRFLAVGADWLAHLDTYRAGRRDLPTVAIAGAEAAEAAGVDCYATWRDAHPPEDPGRVPVGSDVALQLYSSGTTGRPKGVLLTQDNVAAGVGLYGPLVGLDAASVSMVAMPMFHIGGVGWLFAGLAVGAPSVLVRDVVPSDLVERVVSDGVTHAFVVPAVLQFMLGVPGVGERDFSRLHTLLYGASPISERVLAQSIRTFGCHFVQVYGLTETTGTVAYLPAADHDPDGPARHRLRACGLPTPGTELRVVDPATGADVAVGEIGEIWIRGATVMAGYWNLPEATADAVTADGWLRSGDAGYVDADGYYYLHDRVKDMIVSGGENVYPAEVENALMAHPAVADAAVIGVPDERWGETPKAILVAAPGAEVGEEEILAHCRTLLAGFKCPTSVEWVDALPRNPSGKILKKDLRAPYWAGRTRAVG